MSFRILTTMTWVLLIGDSGTGVVYSLNVATGATASLLDDVTMKPLPNEPVGIDGLQILNDKLFYRNYANGTVYTMPLSDQATQSGFPKLLAQNSQVDDFTVDALGNALLTIIDSNQVKRLDTDGTLSIVATAIIGPTSCKFGRTMVDHNALYVSTNGGLGVGPGATAPGGTLSLVRNVEG